MLSGHMSQLGTVPKEYENAVGRQERSILRRQGGAAAASDESMAARIEKTDDGLFDAVMPSSYAKGMS